MAKYPKIKCIHCSEKVCIRNIKQHQDSCRLNPEMIAKHTKGCPVCKKPFYGKDKSSGKEKITCSYACANKHFNGRRRKLKRYRSICFRWHQKKCIICGEDKIVDVHHLDENNSNNDPGNLVPLCPTHHAYLHSRHRHLIIAKVYRYVAEFLSVAQSG